MAQTAANDNEGQVRVKRGRKPRFTSDQLVRRTLDAALDAVLRAGVSSGLDAVRIEKVIVEADVPRAATYELWDGHGAGTSQENLRRAVVVEIIRNMPAGNVHRTTDYALEAIARHQHIIDAGDPDELRALRSELIRDVGSFNYRLLQDQRWRVYKTLVSSIGTQQDPELRDAVAEGEDALVNAYGAMFSELADIFNMELRPDFEMSHFVMSTYALNEGLSNRVGSTFDDQTLGRDGADWTVFAVGVEALVAHYFVASAS